MPSIIAFIIILGIVVGVMTIFLLGSYVIPRPIAALAPMTEDGRVKTAIRASTRMPVRNSRNCDLHYILGLAYLNEGRQEIALMKSRTVNDLGAFSELYSESEFRRPAETKENRDELSARHFLASCCEKTRRLDDAIGQRVKAYATGAVFRDVAKKLSRHQSLPTDDHIKDYLTASAAEFQELCRTVVTVRRMYDDMKTLSIPRAVLAASPNFSRRTAEFAVGRPNEPVDRKDLQELLGLAEQ